MKIHRKEVFNRISKNFLRLFQIYLLENFEEYHSDLCSFHRGKMSHAYVWGNCYILILISYKRGSTSRNEHACDEMTKLQ